MGTMDQRVDAYIAKAKPFAQPILSHVRALIHRACPEVTETIKWGSPAFDYKGPYLTIAAFKEHCAVDFWKGVLLKDAAGFLKNSKSKGGEAMGNFGRICSLQDLPPDKVMLGFLKQAKKLNDDGVKLPPRKSKKAKPVVPPSSFIKALEAVKVAMKIFDAFSPSHKREYLEWINEARTDATRDRRIAQAIDMIAEGKSKNWKYERKKA